jgi:hypothetical protein
MGERVTGPQSSAASTYTTIYASPRISPMGKFEPMSSRKKTYSEFPFRRMDKPTPKFSIADCPEVIDEDQKEEDHNP